MRKTREQTAETRQKIVQIASEQFRTNGIAATAVADVMSTAGLTNGGFYRHFDSKDELVIEAFELASVQMFDELEAIPTKRDGGSLAELAKIYLSTSHRDDPLKGCPIVGIGSELSRINKISREAVTASVLRLTEITADRINEKNTQEIRAKAIAAVSTMVGGGGGGGGGGADLVENSIRFEVGE